MLRCYVIDHQRDCVDYIEMLTYAHNSGFHASTKHSRLALVLSRTPSYPAIFFDEEETVKNE